MSDTHNPQKLDLFRMQPHLYPLLSIGLAGCALFALTAGSVRVVVVNQGFHVQSF